MLSTNSISPVIRPTTMFPSTLAKLGNPDRLRVGWLRSSRLSLRAWPAGLLAVELRKNSRFRGSGHETALVSGIPGLGLRCTTSQRVKHMRRAGCV